MISFTAAAAAAAAAAAVFFSSVRKYVHPCFVSFCLFLFYNVGIENVSEAACHCREFNNFYFLSVDSFFILFFNYKFSRERKLPPPLPRPPPAGLRMSS